MNDSQLDRNLHSILFLSRHAKTLACDSSDQYSSLIETLVQPMLNRGTKRQSEVLESSTETQDCANFPGFWESQGSDVRYSQIASIGKIQTFDEMSSIDDEAIVADIIQVDHSVIRVGDGIYRGMTVGGLIDCGNIDVDNNSGKDIAICF